MILAIDIGGSSIKFATIDKDKNISNKGSINTELDDYNLFIKNLKEVYDQYNFVDGISIGIPGSVDETGTSTGISAIPCIYQNNVKKDLEEYSNKRVEIENDANCSVISELWNEEQVNDVVSIVIGTGIGGAIISGGKLITGAFGSAGEIGLISDVDENNKIINTTISMSQAARKFSQENGVEVSGKKLTELQSQGNELADKAVKDFYRRTALLAMNIEFLFNPEKIVFSGAIINEPMFLENVIKSYNQILEANEGMYNPKSILSISQYGPDSNLIGATYNWYRKAKQND